MRLNKRVDEESVDTPLMPYPGYPYLPKPYSTPEDQPFPPEPVAPDEPENPLVPYLDPFGIRNLPDKYNPFKRRFYDPLFDPFGLRDAVEGESQPMRLNKRMVSEMAAKEINVSEFPNPLRGRIKNIFQKKGQMDGSEADDKVGTKFRGWSANQLKPYQSAIYLGKALGMAIGGVKGGNLGSMVSGDNHILDGHHRWAATLLAEPRAKIFGTEVDLGIGDLVPVLRSLGDAFGNKRRGEPAGGDVNIYDASVKDAMDAITDGKNMNPKFYNRNKAMAWLESIGGEPELARRLKFIQSKTPPAGAPPRNQMPVIDADSTEDKLAATLLQRGDIDVRPPYAKVR
jgi:hypothetical protein